MVQVAPYVGLANRWFQPLTHLSVTLRARSLLAERVCKCSIFSEKIKIIVRKIAIFAKTKPRFVMKTRFVRPFLLAFAVFRMAFDLSLIHI